MEWDGRRHGFKKKTPARHGPSPGGNRELWMVFEQRSIHRSEMTPVLTPTADMGAALEEGRLEAGDEQGTLRAG